METNMETMESTKEKQEVETENTNEANEGYRNLVDFNNCVGQIFGPDLRGYSN